MSLRTETSGPSHVEGDAYEDLLQRKAENVKGGAGQELSRFSAGSAKWLRFDDALPRLAVTPRPLIAAMVDVVATQPGQAICDPACGTGGFLLAAHDYLAKHHALDRAQKKKLKSGTFFGIELVDNRDDLPLRRLCQEASGVEGRRCRAAQSGRARATSSSISSSTSSPSSSSTVARRWCCLTTC